MYKDKKIAVVVPAYNEEKQIVSVLESMPDFVDYIIVVDDASTDHTNMVIQQCVEINKKIVLISHKKNQGVGGAIASGYQWARDHDIEATAVMAGDGQMNPSDLPILLDCVVSGEVDYSKANRLIYAKASEIIPKARFFGNSILSFLTKIASGYWHVSDSQTGYTVINLKALKIIEWDRMYKRYGQPNDLLIRLNVHNFKVRDIPLKPIYNIGETSKLKIRKVIFKISLLLLKQFFWRLKQKYIIRDFHPLVFFYCYGLFSIIVSFLFFIRLLKLWINSGIVPEMTLIILLFTLGSGLQALFFGMWMDQEYNKELK